MLAQQAPRRGQAREGRLGGYLALIGYPVPDDAEPGHVGDTIRDLRPRLERGLPLTAVAAGALGPPRRAQPLRLRRHAGGLPAGDPRAGGTVTRPGRTEVDVDEWLVAPGRALAVAQGDITRIAADAIVNAANERLLAGGGVDGAIHRAGGPAVMADLERRYGRAGVRSCPVGGAVVSAAGDLPARWVVHAVGPVWRGGGGGEADLLASAYAASLRLADGLGAASVTFPAISTGVFGYPADLAADVAVRALADGLRPAASVRLATIVAYSGDSLAPLEAALGRARTGG